MNERIKQNIYHINVVGPTDEISEAFVNAKSSKKKKKNIENHFKTLIKISNFY